MLDIRKEPPTSIDLHLWPLTWHTYEALILTGSWWFVLYPMSLYTVFCLVFNNKHKLYEFSPGSIENIVLSTEARGVIWEDYSDEE